MGLETDLRGIAAATRAIADAPNKDVRAVLLVLSDCVDGAADRAAELESGSWGSDIGAAGALVIVLAIAIVILPLILGGAP